MPQPQNVGDGCLDFMPHFAVPDENPADFTRLEFLKPFTYARVGQQADWHKAGPYRNRSSSLRLVLSSAFMSRTR